MKERIIELKIEGMHCVSCERTIKNSLSQVAGVKFVEVSYVAGEARVKGESSLSHEALVNAIRSTGYRAVPLAGEDEEAVAQKEERHFKRELFLVILSAILTFPLVFQMVVPIVPLWLEFVLATIVQFGMGWRFYVGSFWALKTFSGNMDLLIGLGTSAAYFYSAVVFFAGLDRHVYFESSASIITLILLGRLLELRTKRRASGAIKALLKLQPKIARVQRDGTWKELPVEEMVVGDLFQVRPGDKVSIDGEVIEGESHIDESMLTGESAPVSKKVGSKIFGGTQNQQGALVAKAVAVGRDTALSGIIKLVQEAQSSRAPIQKMADQISAVFVPVVVAISLIAWILWWIFGPSFTEALINAVAVLVIACPCALGMATPTVIMVASGLGARSGILIKNAEAIQQAEKLSVIAVDKTGTLTEGKPTLTDVIPDTEEIRKLAASLEAFSEHPVAQNIAAAFEGEKERVTQFEAVTGKGVKGMIGERELFIGSLRWMEEKKLSVERSVTDPLEREGKTVVALSDTSHILGYLAVADTLRPHSKEGVAQIQKQGIEVVMLTGDHQQTAQAIATEAGITTFQAEILPQDKATAVERLKQEKRLVGMVGDGVNDAPALAAADVGFAMSTGTDIAIEASDITLMRNDLRHVARAIDLSKATFRKVRQNLFFAFIYNILGIPLAAFGLLNPIIAGGAMALSSLCVISNALLLNRWKPKSH